MKPCSDLSISNYLNMKHNWFNELDNIVGDRIVSNASCAELKPKVTFEEFLAMI